MNTDIAYAAEQLLNNAAVERALSQMRQDLKDRWAICPLDRPETMVRLRMELQAIDSLEATMRGFVYDSNRK